MHGLGMGRHAWRKALGATLLVFLGTLSPALALEAKEESAADKRVAKECPNVVVITNVHVNVATWIKVQGDGGDGKKAQPMPTPTATEEPKLAEKPSLADVFAALADLPAMRENVVVISNVKINVATWLDLIGPPKKPPARPEPKPKP